LRVELASALRQQEYDSKERKRLEEAKGELESKLKEVEVKLAHMSTALHAAQEAEASQLRRLTTAVSMSQYRLDADATSALHARVAEAEAAAAAATQKAAAAEAEAAKMAADRHVRTLELNTMRDALRSMEATSDNKAALGKLHEEVLRLRAREVSFDVRIVYGCPACRQTVSLDYSDPFNVRLGGRSDFCRSRSSTRWRVLRHTTTDWRRRARDCCGAATSVTPPSTAPIASCATCYKSTSRR
jgi:DNA repair exonuclease SbcCD ATPase subunit